MVVDRRHPLGRAARALASGLALCALALGASAQSDGRIGGLNPDSEAQQGKIALIAPDLAGNFTASGVRYDPRERTAAHANLPFGVRLRVTRVDDGRTVVVTITDRIRAGGPYILLVSPAAGARIGLKEPGVVEVKTELIGFAKLKRAN